MTLRPQLAAEWHPTLNGDLSPNDVTVSSDKEVWWRCPDKGHEWPVRVAERTARRTGCPVCAHRQIAPEDSLAARFPEVAAEWHPTRNGPTRPVDVAPHARLKAYWRCQRRHTWSCLVSQRTTMTTGCPRCAR